MDADRFDAFTRFLAGRLSRRSALQRGGAGIAAATVISLGDHRLGRTAPARQAPPSWYMVARRYELTGAVGLLQQALAEYAQLLAQEPGFVEYTVFTTDDSLTSVTVFATQAQEEAAAGQLSDWVEQNLGTLLSDPEETTTGETIVHAANPDALCPSGQATQTPTPAPVESPTATAVPATSTTTAVPCTGEGCECATGTQSPCDDGLVCCANQPGLPGGPGVCRSEDQCGCTGQGCHCSVGVQDACNDGLECCPGQPGLHGGPGICQPEGQCPDDSGAPAAATPVQ